MTARDLREKQLLTENQTLSAQLAEAQETLRAIQHGEVDALVVTTGQGPQIYTLTGAETPYRLLIEQMKEGAVMLSNENCILYCNRGFSEMVRIPLDKIVGSRIDEFVDKEHLEDLRKLLGECRLGKTVKAKEITFQTCKDKIVPASVSANSLTVDGITTTFIVATDLSQHMEEDLKIYTEELESTVRQRTKQLQEKERLAAIGQTAGMVGHDIRNPLQTIVSELFLVREELTKISSVQVQKNLEESINSIEEQTLYINKIVADLQDYTKPLAPKPQVINIAASIRDALSTVRIPSNVTVNTALLNGATQIYTDPIFLKRILVNLVTNALQAMPVGGTLSIADILRDDKVSVSVKDTGSGIPEAVKPQIFKPLFTTKAKGQGLGLAVVKRLTEALGGDVTFESQAGEGTTFTVTLPFNP